MGMRQCIVCKREVPQGYERDHLQANHLGPHTFWFDAKQFTVMEPSMTIAELKKLANTNAGYQFYEEREGGDVPWSDGQSVDLTQRPHFYAVPPATMRGHVEIDP
jgi:hypothetical protein